MQHSVNQRVKTANKHVTYWKECEVNERLCSQIQHYSANKNIDTESYLNFKISLLQVSENKVFLLVVGGKERVLKIHFQWLFVKQRLIRDNQNASCP